MWMAILKPKSSENTPKNAKNNNLLKTNRIVKPKHKLSWCPLLTFSFPGGAICPYAPVVVKNNPNMLTHER